MGKSKHKNIAVEVVRVCVILLVMAAIFEIVLRASSYFGWKLELKQEDLIAGLRYPPNSQFHFNDNGRSFKVKINSHGWRDKERSVKKPAGVYRVAVLGDSYVESFQIERKKTFLSLAEEKLKKDYNLEVELMNFGRGGYSQAEEMLVLRNYVEDFSPDAVVLFFYPPNDIEEMGREGEHYLVRTFYKINENGELILRKGFTDLSDPGINSFFDWVIRNSAFASFIYKRGIIISHFFKEREHRRLNRESRDLSSGKIEGYLTLCTSLPDPEYLTNYFLCKKLIKAMAEYCHSKGRLFLLVVIDTPAYRPEVENIYKTMDCSFNGSFFEDDLTSFSESIAVKCIGLHRIFKKHYGDSGKELHWGHWNYQGHELVADALADKLGESVYLK